MAASRKNEWKHVTFDEIAKYIEDQEIAQLTFAKEIGVTNSTFHHWKSGKSVPSDEMQLKIAEFIGKKGGKVSKKKASKKKAAAAPKTETLDDLLQSSGRRRGKKKTAKKAAAKKKTAKKTKKKATAKKKTAKKTAAKTAKKKTAKKARAAKAAPALAPAPAPAAPPKAPKATKKKTAKRGGRPPKKAAAPATNGVHANGNGAHVPSERAYLVGRYMDHHGVDSVEEFGRLIETVNGALS